MLQLFGWFFFNIIIGLTVAGQGVLESPLFANSNTAPSNSLYSGQLWATIDSQSKMEFQAVLLVATNVSSVSASIEIPGKTIDLDFGKGESRAYSGCSPLSDNPYLNISSPPPEVTCQTIIQGMFYQGQQLLDGSLVAELLAQHGLIRIQVHSLDGQTTELGGMIIVTGVFEQRKFTLVTIESIQVVPDAPSVRLTWKSEPRQNYAVVSLNDVKLREWKKVGGSLVALSTSASVEIPISRSLQLFRILKLE